MTNEVEIYKKIQHLQLSDKLLLEVRGHTALLILNNPSANIWDADMLVGVTQLVEYLNNDKDIYALVITGAGDKFFSAGADLKLFASGDPAMARKMSRLFGETFEALSNYQGVTIAAINGYAMGGGLECVLACDIRIAEEHAQLALPETSVGLLPCAGGTQKLPWLIGEGWAKRMILCGERVDAKTAERIGLVEEVVATGKSRSKALELAEKVAQQSPVAVRRVKPLIQGARSNAPDHWLPAEREAFVDLFDSQDTKEGVNAFLEKRKAQWENC